MNLKEELLKCVDIENKVKKQVAIAGIITEALECLGIIPIVVGGAAVDFYTYGQYATADVDFVSVITEDVKKTMNDLGFVKKDKYWRIPDTDIMVEFPSDRLVGDLDRIEPVEFEGKTIYYIGLEDLILNRVQEAEHWKDLNSADWAQRLMASYYDKIDWSYCHKKSNEYGCMKKFEQIQRKAKKIKDKIDR